MPKNIEIIDSQEMIYRQELGERLKSFRVKNGIRQQEVAAETGIQQPSLVRYESGKRCPSLYFVKQFVEKFGCDLHWLVFGGDDQK